MGLNIDLDTELATALLFGIRSDTLDFLRGATHEEYDAAEHLHEFADQEMIQELSTIEE